MSNFFDSEIVKEELQEIRDLQNEIYGKIPTLNMFSHDEKVDHIEKLETLLEKQRLMFTRLSLSDDSEAIKIVSPSALKVIISPKEFAILSELIFCNSSHVVPLY